MPIKAFFILFFIFNTLQAHSTLSNYQVINQSILLNNQPYRLIRSFNFNSQPHYLAVNEESLKTSIIPKQSFSTRSSSTLTRYQKALEKYSASPFQFHNDGIQGVENSSKVYITTDLCPSSKRGYEDAFYKRLIREYSSPTPITIFISGGWIKRHSKEFKELLSFAKNKELDITWGNHTHRHRYQPKAPLQHNFLLLPNTDIVEEVIELEKLLLSNGVTPSILFRFPGLVSDQKSMQKIKQLGLIAVGSNSWLAKNEKIQEGSIILLHGNKNEPLGIQKANRVLFKSDFQIGKLLEDL